MNVLHTSNLIRVGRTQLQKIFLCEVASFQAAGRVGVLPRRKHRPDQTVSLPLSAVPHYSHRQKESVPSRQDPTYSDSRRATPSAPKLSIDPRPTAGGVPLLSG